MLSAHCVETADQTISFLSHPQYSWSIEKLIFSTNIAYISAIVHTNTQHIHVITIYLFNIKLVQQYTRKEKEEKKRKKQQKKTHAHRNYNKTRVKTKLYIVSQS